MRLIKQLFGFNPEQITHYISLLEAENLLLQKVRIQEYKSFHSKKTELLRKIETLNAEMTKLDEMEHNIRLWIEKNK